MFTFCLGISGFAALKMTCGLQHWANIDLTFPATLCQYFQSIHMHVLLHWINRDCVQNECSFIYLAVPYWAGTQSSRTNPPRMPLIKSLNPYQTKNRALDQNSSSLWSFSAPCQCSPPLRVLWLHDLSQPEHPYRQRTSSVSQPANRKSEVTLSELSLRHSLHPWTIELDGGSKGILKVTVKPARNAHTVPSDTLRSIERSGPDGSIWYLLCDRWAEWKMKTV